MNYWDSIAENKGYYFGDNDNPVRLLSLELIKDGESLLDIGCGNGQMFNLLKEKNRKINYKGIDYSEKMIANCKEKFPDNDFEVIDIRNLSQAESDSYDTVYIRHCLENIKDWKECIRQMYRIANKRVIIDMRRDLVNEPSRLLEEKEDTVCWDINFNEFNMLCRGLTVNVAYLQQKVGDSNTFIVLGKRPDEVVFTLDDFHETNHHLDILLDLKSKYPGLKVTLFTIPTKCGLEFLQSIRNRFPWMDIAVHGFYHDTDRGPRECDIWTKEEAKTYLEKVESMGVFSKVFKAPGWCINIETYEVLAERGYCIMDHKDHDRWENEIIMPRLTTGATYEVNGHIQQCNMNGLYDLAYTKCNFRPDTKFYFVSEVAGTEFDKQHRLENLI